MNFLTTSPLWISGIFLVGVTSLIAMMVPVLVRRRVPLDRLRSNNEVAGFKFAVVGVLYAVLLAFAVIVVWEKFSEAENNVALEAGAAATIYRLTGGIDDQAGRGVRDRATDYLNAAIAHDWPAMERGGESPLATQALNEFYAAVLRFHPVDARGAAVLSEILNQLDLVTQARRARIVVASGIVPGVLWFVLFGGAFVTIAFTFFFGTENLRAQALMTAALSVLIFSGLLIIIAIDHPFAGTVKVDPEPLIAVLVDFARVDAP